MEVRMKKAVAYVRFSSDNQRQESIDAQVRAINEYCSKHDIQLIKIYADAAQSATTDKREQFLEMMNDLKKKAFSVVIVHKLDRFSRDRYDSAYYKKLLKDNGVTLISVTEQIDDSPESVILESILEGMAEYYSKNLAREVRKGLKENALRSIHNGGIPPLGYNVVNQHYVINEIEASAVKLIFELYAGGKGYNEITGHLNSLGLKTKVGSPFGKNSVAEILINEKYLGTYVFNKRLSKKTGNRKYKQPEEIIRIENALPAIISQELWDSVQLRRDKNKRIRHAPSREYLFSGFMVCGECGGAYTGAGYSGKKRDYNYHYKCVHRKRTGQCTGLPVNAKKIESFIINHILEHHLTEDAILGIAKPINENIALHNNSFSDRRKPLQNKLKELQSKRVKHMDLYYDGVLDKETLYKDLVGLDKQIKALDEEIQMLPILKPNIDIDTKVVIRMLKSMFARAKDNDPKINKILIDAFVKKVTVHKDHIDIILYKIPEAFVPPASDKNGGDEGSRTPVQIVSTFKRLQFSLN